MAHNVDTSRDEPALGRDGVSGTPALVIPQRASSFVNATGPLVGSRAENMWVYGNVYNNLATPSAHGDRSKSSSTSEPFLVPFPRNRSFIARDAEMSKLERVLFSSFTAPLKESFGLNTTAVVGLGGVGKTNIVLEFTYRTRLQRPSCAVLWVPATSLEALQQACLKIGRQLGVDGIESADADVLALVQSRLSQDTGPEWLMVYDNVDDYDIWKGIRDKIPRANHGRIVITSRNSAVAQEAASPADNITVTEMTKDAALKLLQNSMVDQRKFADFEADAERLVSQLTYLALAIVQAAAYINQRGVSLRRYLDLLAEQEDTVVELLGQDFQDQGRYQDSRNPIATTWLISFEQIRLQNPVATDFLSLMACIDSRAIPISLFVNQDDAKTKLEVDSALGVLHAYSFVTRRDDDETLDLHRLVHLAMRNWLQQSGNFNACKIQAILRLEQNIIPHEQKAHVNRHIWQPQLPHAVCVLDAGLDSLLPFNGDDAVLWLFNKVGRCFHSDGRYKDDLQMQQRAVKISRKFFGLEDYRTLHQECQLACQYNNVGRASDAESQAQRVAIISEAVFGAEYNTTLQARRALAIAHSSLGRLDAAATIHFEILAIRRRLAGESDYETCLAEFDVADVYYQQGRPDEAKELLATLRRKLIYIYGDDHYLTLDSTFGLADIYRQRRNLSGAVELMLEVRENRCRTLGPEHPSSLQDTALLARILAKQGRHQESEAMMRDVVTGFEEIYGVVHLHSLSAIQDLCRLLRMQNRWHEAEQLARKAERLSKDLYGTEHFESMNASVDVAVYPSQNGEVPNTEARERLAVSVPVLVETLGTDHHDSKIALRLQSRCEVALQLEDGESGSSPSKES